MKKIPSIDPCRNRGNHDIVILHRMTGDMKGAAAYEISV